MGRFQTRGVLFNLVLTILSLPRFPLPSPGLKGGSFLAVKFLYDKPGGPSSTSDCWCVAPRLSDLKSPVCVSPSRLPKWKMKYHGGSPKAAAAGAPRSQPQTHLLPQKMPFCEPPSHLLHPLLQSQAPPARAPWPGRPKPQRRPALTPVLPPGGEEAWWESTLALLTEQKPGGSGGDMAWVPLNEANAPAREQGEKIQKYYTICLCFISLSTAHPQPGNSYVNAAGCPRLLWLCVQSSSSNALSLNTAKCTSLHTPSAHPYTCIVRCGCASHPSHPAGDALSPEHVSLSAPSPAT